MKQLRNFTVLFLLKTYIKYKLKNINLFRYVQNNNQQRKEKDWTMRQTKEIRLSCYFSFNQLLHIEICSMDLLMARTCCI